MRLTTVGLSVTSAWYSMRISLSAVSDVGHLDIERAGIVLLAVGAGVGEPQTDVVAVVDLLGRPHPLVEPEVPAVQAVRVIVDRQLIGLVVEGELTLRDAVGIPSGDAAEVGALVHILVEVVEAERHVRQRAIAIGDLDRLEDAPVRHDLDLHPGGVRERVQLDVHAVGGAVRVGDGAKWRAGDPCAAASRHGGRRGVHNSGAGGDAAQAKDGEYRDGTAVATRFTHQDPLVA